MVLLATDLTTMATHDFPDRRSDRQVRRGWKLETKCEVHCMRWCPTRPCLAVSYSQENRNGSWHIISLHDATATTAVYRSVAHVRHLFPARNIDFSLDGRYIQSHYQDIKDPRVKESERFIADIHYHSSRTGEILKEEVYPKPNNAEWDTWTCTQGALVQTLANEITDHLTTTNHRIGNAYIDGGVVSCHRNEDDTMLVSTHSNGNIRLWRWPLPEGTSCCRLMLKLNCFTHVIIYIHTYIYELPLI